VPHPADPDQAEPDRVADQALRAEQVQAALDVWAEIYLPDRESMWR
jgi:hypothetical protein